MKIKQAILLLPTILLPYLALPVPAYFLLGSGSSHFRAFMASLFQYGIYYIGAFILLCILAAITLVIYLISSIKRNTNAFSLAKIAMITKLIQIPAYLAIFIVGFFFMLMIWTYWITFLLILLSCYVLLLSGILSATSVVLAVRQGNFKISGAIWMIILQNIFCADVVTSCICYHKLKRSQFPK